MVALQVPIRRQRKAAFAWCLPGCVVGEGAWTRNAARDLLTDGIDPSAQRKAAKREAAGREINSFEYVAREWYPSKRMSGFRITLPTYCGGWSPTFSRIRREAIDEISAPGC